MTKHTLSRARRRLAVALAVAGAAILTTAALATAGAAQTQATTLHLLGTSQKQVGFFPRGEPRPGDRIGFGDKVTGDDTGYDRGVCTIMSRSGPIACTIWVKLSRGTLTAQGLLPQHAHNTPVAITGGTGAYNGARGTAYATEISQAKTRITVSLLP